ncbi:TPR-like protein [Cylindrobasidium torrendii FP15055 ss-10]|uniref:TPR-like protein n=1 Tax=Cylindrobasidium torrendii FP15055 ss-10 TaxID=1314674 RepID=A0A0D7BVG7_9AGAR|nr:TPR-like protein [Cylindrobasidium torrendii FP15055 ss-10]
MALPMLVSGSECGPSNALQGLSKRFDQDRGPLQDRVVAAGSSRDAFRSQQVQNSRNDQDVARFFGTGPTLDAKRPFNFNAMASSLPSLDTSPVQRHPQQAAPSGWASDFMIHQMAQSATAQTDRLANDSARGVASPVSGMQTNVNMQQQPWNTTRIMPAPSFHAIQPIQPAHDQKLWDREFASQEQSVTESIPEQKQEARTSYDEQDELARTAGILLDTVRNEQNPKFQASAFMGLMEQLRDHKVVVEGNQMVDAGETSYAEGSSSYKGKGKAVDHSMPMFDTQTTGTRLGQDPLRTTTSPLQMGGMNINRNLLDPEDMKYWEQEFQELKEMTDGIQEDDTDAYMRRENAEYTAFWDDVKNTVGRPNQQMAEWGHLQEDWDQFEANTYGIRKVDAYQFQHNNPYILGDSTRTRQHAMHSGYGMSISESVLELEAIVQRDPGNAKAWYDLGVKQQENEREQKALQALSQAVELDPGHLPSWLALAVSHTNDGDRSGTFTSVFEWAKRNQTYSTISQPSLSAVEGTGSWDTERSGKLMDSLMTMARAGMQEGVIDPDVQIALAVLFNSNEDYDKAQDCFKTALAVRPEDWLLYNRVGATMANNGNAEEALQYYYRALEMNPSYVRARFNLGISCISLKRYDEAAHHILDALVLQESDAAPDAEQLNDRRNTMSRALWDSLKTACLHMQRLDLSILCDQRDLEGFRERFAPEFEE